MTHRLSIGTIAVYWFTLLAGLGVYSATANHVDLESLWSGVIGGTLLGQLCALHGVRAWFLTVLVFGVLFWVGFAETELFLMALIPATYCGWASLSDRGSLFAFWFPAVIWMLSILDHGKGALQLDGGSAALLGGLALMFLAFLYARETRRTQMWKRIAPTPLAESKEPAVLREVPRLQLGVAGYSLLGSAAIFAMTAWLAPKLWQVEPMIPELHVAHVPAVGSGPARRLPCCNAITACETTQARVKEYLELGRAHDDETEHVNPGECVVCNDHGVPVDLYRYDGYAYGGTSGTSGEGRYAPPELQPPATSDSPPSYSEPTYTPRSTSYTPPAYTPPAPMPNVIAEPTPPQLPEPPPQAPPPPSHAAPSHVVTQHAKARPAELPLMSWVLAALAGALALQLLVLGLRPVRRLVTLRHLRKPFWNETVDQRVSNWWHLVLVGLRDAGWRPISGEAPRELAKRLAIDGVENAASILERARHGVGIDAADLAAMGEASEIAYRASRAKATPFQRLLGWFRRPLV